MIVDLAYWPAFVAGIHFASVLSDIHPRRDALNARLLS
jgi:hypothetical protein